MNIFDKSRVVCATVVFFCSRIRLSGFTSDFMQSGVKTERSIKFSSNFLATYSTGPPCSENLCKLRNYLWLNFSDLITKMKALK